MFLEYNDSFYNILYINMKYILFCLTIYYVILTNILLFVTKRYFKVNYLFLSVILFLYLTAIVLAIFGILYDLNIIVVDNQTVDYLNELDFLVEIPEVNNVSNNVSEDDENMITRFFGLFSNSHNNHCCLNTVELRNSHYINYKAQNFNNIEWLDIYKKYTYITMQNQELLYFIDCFEDVLNDLELIQNDLAKIK